MALVCPVGHPPGVGTSYCRLCGRDCVESPEEPVVAAVAGPPPAPEPRLVTSVLPAPEAPAPPPAPEPPVAPAAPELSVPASEPEPPVLAPAPEPPVLELPVQPGPRHAADALDEPEPLPGPDPSPAVAMVERRLLTLTAAATFVGGLVLGGGAVAFLG